MKTTAIFLIVCAGFLVGVHAQWDWGNGDPNENEPAPDPAAPGAPEEIDRNGSLIGCPCVTTQETNLVCGTDGNTYGNMGKLRCAQRCKAGLELSHLGTCAGPLPVPPPVIPSQ